MKGVILAGGTGTRMRPMTKVVNKHLLPVYNKPLIYYPMTTLMLTGVRDFLIISNPNDLQDFKTLLGNGSQFGINISYRAQVEPRGIVDALIISESYISEDDCILILGDNIFYGAGFAGRLKQKLERHLGAHIFTAPVDNPEDYGVAEFNQSGEVISIVEKPNEPKSDQAITGLYVLDRTACTRAKSIKESLRGELEITDLLSTYLADENIGVSSIGRGVAWLDAGTPENLYQASTFVCSLETRQGLIVASPEEVAHRMQFINTEMFEKLIDNLEDGDYKSKLQRTFLVSRH